MLYPFTFEPIYKERVWGGRRLAELYGRVLPPSSPIGESWEISDRPGDESVIANGSLAGRTLHWLMTEHGRELLGSANAAPGGRFPLLCKILDARDRLSLQVHPPSHMAAALGGDPKTEMWYIAEADANADLFVGLRRGVTREAFADKVSRGEVAECFHRIPVHAGDTMFLPSGRVHAIGAGLVIFEIQQNSDTTYRVFDWNRSGLDGQPRELHIEQSMASIDFEDFEPSLVDAPWTADDGLRVRELVHHDVFHVAEAESTAASPFAIDFEGQALQIVAVISGRVEARGGGETVTLQAGQFALLPASLTDKTLRGESGTRVLLVAAG